VIGQGFPQGESVPVGDQIEITDGIEGATQEEITQRATDQVDRPGPGGQESQRATPELADGEGGEGIIKAHDGLGAFAWTIAPGRRLGLGGRPADTNDPTPDQGRPLLV